MSSTFNHTRIAFLVAASFLMTGSPANAQSLIDTRSFEFESINVSRYVSDVYRRATNVLNKNIADNFETDTANLLQNIIGNAVGVLGFPSPIAISEQLEGELAGLPQADITKPVPMAESGTINRELNRVLIGEQIAAVLGEDGQRISREKAETTAAVVLTNEQLAVQANTALSTQAVMKAMAQQQARSTALMGAVHTELLQSRQDTAAQSLALTDISATLDQQLTTQQAERRGEAITGLQQAAAAGLF